MIRLTTTGFLPLAVCVLAATASAPAADAAEKTGPVGTWEMKGTDTAGTRWTGILVLKKGAKAALVGHIDWNGKGGPSDGASGRELIRGTFDPEARTLKIKGYKLQREKGISLGSYAAELSENASRLEKGTWSDDGAPGEWTAARKEKADRPAEAAGEETGFIERVYQGPKRERKYVVFVPTKYKKDADKKFPVIVFLHGAGEGGDDPWLPTKVGIGPTVDENQDTFPFIVIFPQFGEGGLELYLQEVVGILDDVLKSYRADPQRVSLTGVSTGGGHTWEVAFAYPDRWAALVPVCGWSRDSAEGLEAIKDIPCWCFHGAKDEAVPIRHSRKMIKALKEVGGEPRLTVDPEGAHTYEYFDSVYGTKELWDWLLKQRRASE